MKQPSTYTKTGTVSKNKVTLDKAIFDVAPTSHELLQQVYDGYVAQGRNAYPKTKLRGEVRGGGRKPWRQKGTGRARVGSIRSPIWRGGGVTFGPTGNENHLKKVNKQAKRLAIKQALSLSLAAGNFHVIESIEVKSSKTKDVTSLLKKMHANGRVLLIVSEKEQKLVRATQNIPKVNVVKDVHLTVYDLLNADFIVAEVSSLENLNKWLGGTSS